MKIIFQDDDGAIIKEETLTEEESMALLTNVVDTIERVLNAVKEKARRRIDDIVTRSGKGSKHTDPATKLSIIADLKAENNPLMKSAKDKEAEKEK